MPAVALPLLLAGLAAGRTPTGPPGFVFPPVSGMFQRPRLALPNARTAGRLTRPRFASSRPLW
ncbi:hypothetical protein [Limnochorda pilosa]|uniref:Uncharacterized protein n=1 Tax=Limnochorda pilosa TaxID=1555112 RepID=A0A0K2SJQ1_LIMPI|nr:hypothetical protein [Limnochorda pilosa]BAS27343.1 hypothetical protein LIP_1495 [Limnochorda pilosa]